MANGVNLTDGMDGLAGGTLAFSFVASCSSRCSTCPTGEPGAALRADHRRAARLPVVQRPPRPDLHGRRRRAGAGATLAVTALITGQILILPLIGIIFVVETLS
jgi:phospho-N-acetylmuramoyl-pentapeptide-transferase